MHLLVRAAMVFFATLLAAGLVALGAPLLAELIGGGAAAPMPSQAVASIPEASTARPGR